MGNAESSEIHKFDGCETLGYRILGVQPDSPASRAGLVSFFDFLVGANGQLLFGIDDGKGGEYFEDIDFPALLKSSVDQELELLVWNIKNKTQRFVTLTPSTSWGGKGLLGVTIRMDDYAIAEENLLRVLSVEKRSPAALAGLTPNTDYLLGTTIDSFENEDVLADILEDNEDNVVEIYVYNTESDVVRVVTLIPSLKWGGNGLLGAEIGRGYLHSLPKNCRNTLGVSFDRKVLVDKNNTTTCGAVDLKLNEDASKDKVLSQNQTSLEIESLYLDHKTNNNNTVSVADEQSTSNTHTVEVNTGSTREQTDSSLLNESQNKKENDMDIPVSQVSKFPSIPQLEDFTLIGMSSKSRFDESDDVLPPPPICNVDDSQDEEELTAIDLR